MVTCVKPVDGFFNSSFGAFELGAFEYACRDFFLLLGSFLVTITCSSSKIYEESNKEEKSDILASCPNSLGSLELIRRVSKGSEKQFLSNSS
jgi:hypothetical protein